MCPETGGKSLEEVDLIFMDDRDTLQHGSPASEEAEVASEKPSAVSEHNEKS
jgi:hypothetical protein